MLHDTGAAQSLLVGGVLPLNGCSFTGERAVVQGIGEVSVSTSLHIVNLTSDIVSGSVVVDVRLSLPIKSISLLLGNDLRGSKVTANLEVVEKEIEACVVTRAKAKEC